MKKIVALLLVAVMVLSCLPVLAGSNTAQTKDKIDPNIKVSFKLDKTTLDTGKDDDKIVMTLNFEGGKANGYTYDVYAKYIGGEEKIGRYTYNYDDIIHMDSGRTEKTATVNIWASDFPTRGGTATFFVKGYAAKLVTDTWEEDGETETYTWVEEGTEDFFFYNTDTTTVTIIGSQEEEKTKIEITTDKEVYLPGEDIKINYEVKGIPSDDFEWGWTDLRSYVPGDLDTPYEYLEDMRLKQDAIKGSFTLTAPNFGDRLEIDLSYGFGRYDEYDENDELVKNGWSVDGGSNVTVYLNAIPPEYDELEANLPYINRMYLKKSNSDTLKINITCKNPKATLPVFTWTSSKPEVATVSADGVITPVGVGEAFITGEGKVGDRTYPESFVIIVDKDNSVVTKVKPSKKKLTLKKGATAQINLTFTPATAFDTSVKWKTSDKKVATVKNGLIKAKGKGKCVITVTMKNKKSKATCSIKVTVK